MRGRIKKRMFFFPTWCLPRAEKKTCEGEESWRNNCGVEATGLQDGWGSCPSSAAQYHEEIEINQQSSLSFLCFFFCSSRSEAYSPAAGELLSVILLLVTPCHRSACCARTPAPAPARRRERTCPWHVGLLSALLFSLCHSLTPPLPLLSLSWSLSHIHSLSANTQLL